MKRTVQEMQNIWHMYYKPCIELLMRQDEGHYAAFILVFCCVEHVYRAIHGIPATCRKVCEQEAIEYVQGIWTEYYNPNKTEMREIQNKNMANYANCLLRLGIFNRLKHVGYLTEIVGEEHDYLKKCAAEQFLKDEFSGFAKPITKLELTNDPSNLGCVSQGGGRNEHAIDANYFVELFVSGIDAAYDKALSESE
ncbi:MAG: hypothetical protein OXI77_08515 [Chloroflexota bacterium]|nr:hypothetical protein [Chloroflexota bacterium]MDE2910721.1 hypothetical protein [Chloroflexota bacterium]